MQGSLLNAAQGPVQYEITTLTHTSLDQPDFFLVNGVAMKTMDPRRIQLGGHTQMFQFNMDAMRFEQL